LPEPPRFRRIDATNIGDHAHLGPSDECFFMLEYTSHKDYSFSSTNDLISNLKKKIGSSSPAELRYKAGAISSCASHITGAVNLQNLQSWTLVPVPPSKRRGDPAYDDRVLKICRSIQSPAPLDVRELVYQTQSVVAAHEAPPGGRPSVSDLVAIYAVDEALATPVPTGIIIIDDVLTAGTHYRAMQTVLSRRFPGVPISAMFLARRVFPPEKLRSPDDQ